MLWVLSINIMAYERFKEAIKWAYLVGYDALNIVLCLVVLFARAVAD